MSKAVLMSVQPRWCELIASGKKTVEVRKSKPSIELPFKVYIYQTKKTWVYNIFSKIADWQGKVIGEFVCENIEEYTNYSLEKQKGHIERREKLLRSACMTLRDWYDYIGNYTSDYGCVWHISNLVIYDKPKELSEFKTPPCERPENACENCKYLEVINTPNYYEVECYRENGVYLTRPPQSWCYVEELRE